jgi:hypothetical protein
MEYKYVLLKSSWGIVIFLEVEEIKNSVNSSDTKITDRIFLRVNDSIQLNKKYYESWIVAGIKDLADKIYEKIDGSKICFLLKNLEFNPAHFQEEGLYCAIQEWMAKYYDMQITPVKVEFNKATNRYVFNIPHTR